VNSSKWRKRTSSNLPDSHFGPISKILRPDATSSIASESPPHKQSMEKGGLLTESTRPIFSRTSLDRNFLSPNNHENSPDYHGNFPGHHGNVPDHHDNTVSHHGNSPNHHDNSYDHTSEPLKCAQCCKTFSQRILLQMHLCPKQTNAPYYCGHCPLSFTNASDLRGHVMTHVGEKPFKCGFCARSFVGATTLNNHVQVHTGQKSCLYCNTCDELVCPLCIAKTHNKQHDLCLHYSKHRYFLEVVYLIAQP